MITAKGKLLLMIYLLTLKFLGTKIISDLDFRGLVWPKQ